MLLFTPFQEQAKIHLKFASQRDFGFVILRFRTPLAVNAKGCMNSNTNSSVINVKPTSYSIEILSPDLRETFVLNEVLHEFSTTTSRLERERVRRIWNQFSRLYKANGVKNSLNEML